MKVELKYQNVMDKNKTLDITLNFSQGTDTKEALAVIDQVKTGITKVVGGSMGGPVWNEVTV